MTPARRDVAGLIVVGQQVLHEGTIESKVSLPAAILEDQHELGNGRPLGVDLVANASEKRLVNQRGRLDVGGKDNQHAERHFELLARLQRQEVDASLERRTPP